MPDPTEKHRSFFKPPSSKEQARTKKLLAQQEKARREAEAKRKAKEEEARAEEERKRLAEEEYARDLAEYTRKQTRTTPSVNKLTAPMATGTMSTREEGNVSTPIIVKIIQDLEEEGKRKKKVKKK